ncbi:hypothetical protein [Aurantimicrobium photophilum]|uniref:Uncharacterized protein n=1 Tax=Aurantimicrobium photophilum TaxID=1987356 RepID=A0A2Z3S2X9_9MICO|nr:hypothetical protein [Aurantimicrobium photophilum]AWR21318.1 hypothetical protein AURMO_00709 [Aurantimicrobium photophilum]
MTSAYVRKINLSPLWKWTLGISVASLGISIWYFVDTLAFVFKFSTYEQEAFKELIQFGAVVVLLGFVISNILRGKFSSVPWLLLVASVVEDLAFRFMNSIESGTFNLPLVNYFKAGGWNSTLQEAGPAIALMQLLISGVIYLLLASTVLAFVALKKKSNR